jgi:fructose/tagatose bisphosphate aldolase
MTQQHSKIVRRYLGSGATWTSAGLTVNNRKVLPAAAIAMAQDSALGDPQARAEARWMIWETALALGILPASINGLYAARGRGDAPASFTVPAINLRMLSFDAARAVFRAAAVRRAGAIIFEIARSEMGYTDQRPAEYSASVLAAAICEGWDGPVFIQGDHFQISAKKYGSAPEGEVQAIRDLILESIQAGFFNIDIDTSTLVDLTRSTVHEQQTVNAHLCAAFTAFIRTHQPKGIEISTGGEIGEVGGRNSTEEELRAFLQLFGVELDRLAGSAGGLSKISIQTGTSHGGVVLPDGSMAQVAVDFGTLLRLSRVARSEFGLAGAVQHGASTLPENAFRNFPQNEACEVHLATNFQNIAFEHMPADLRDEMVAWIREHCADERKATDTEEQFLYKARKKAIGPFKAKAWRLPDAARAPIRAAWEKQFGFLFDQLGVAGSADLVRKHVKPVILHKSPADFGATEAGTDDAARDLAD